jgi:hypothetical protein
MKTHIACGVLLWLVTAGCGDAEVIDVVVDAGVDAGGAIADAGDGSCRESADCAASSELCFGPSDVFCGIPPQVECQDDAACGEGRVCHAIEDSCSGDGIGATCGAPCDATSCQGDFACGTSGRCEAIPCGGAGVACRASELCDPTSIVTDGPVDERTHGCVAIACANDATCPATTFCVNGRCQDGVGSCASPPP